MARLLRIREVMQRTGLSRTTIWKLEKEGAFPPRRQLGGRQVAWLESEIDAWIESRPVASPAEEPH